MTVKMYLESREKPEDQAPLEVYMMGMKDGMQWMNTDPAIYCPPGKLVLNIENYMNILDRYIKNEEERFTASDDWRVGMAMRLALVDAFPCPAE